MKRDDILLRDLRSPLIQKIHFQNSRVDTNSGVDGQRELKFTPSLSEDIDELDKFFSPAGPSKNFDEELLPVIVLSLGCKKFWILCALT